MHQKYPDNKEALTYLISVCRDLNLPFEEYYQRLNKLERENMLADNNSSGLNLGNIEFGQPLDYMGQGQFGTAADPGYKGEEVNYSMFSKHNPQAPTKAPSGNNFMKFNIAPSSILP